VRALGLHDDVHRRPLAAALEVVGLDDGWTCVDVGAGNGDVTAALADVVGPTGRVYGVDVDPRRRAEIIETAGSRPQVVPLTQAAEDLALPEEVDLALCRFLLLHVPDPRRVLRRMAAAVRAGGWVVAQEPVTTAGRVGGRTLSMTDAHDPDVGAVLPALVRDVGLVLVDAWAESPAWAGPGLVADHLHALTDVDPRDEPILLPPLVTVIARRL
jgi:ubiquinone/menaquinone biosynthesis C-methylase UbiE